ncbi:MAG: ComEC family competence protein [Proteobacteria bacterium]|nr:ComEC family competence protein [Pseudomonadota bacterium]
MGAADSNPSWVNIIQQQFAADRERFILWLPVWLGVGIGSYFSLTNEPSLVYPLAAGVLCLLLAVFFRRRAFYHRLFLILLTIALGFSAAGLRTRAVDAPVIAFATKPVWVRGTIDKIEHVGKGYRIWLTQVDIWKFSPAHTPAAIRLTVRTAVPEDLKAGDRISVKAALSPPPGPVLPGGYDYSMVAYFERTGAVGYTVTPVERLAEAGGGLALSTHIQHVRQTMTNKVYRPLEDVPGVINDRGSVAASMITGERGAISNAAMEALRISGLAHILSISGLHLVLVTGTCFFLVRLILAAIPPVALRYPIKKWAAFISLIVGFLYLLIADSPVPAERSFIMVGFFLCAILLDRTGTPLRPVAFAAFLILLMEPETLLSASFQMSFAAALALVAAYESVPWLKPDRRDRNSLVWRGFFYVSGIILSSLVAGAATAPFGIYHFGRYSVYGLLSNLGALPVTSFLVMPAAMLGSLLMPFGLERFALIPMGYGVDIILKVSYAVSALPRANIPVHSGNLAALLLAVAGGLWLCLWRENIRFLGIPLLMLSFLILPFREMPDLYFDRGGKLFAMKAGDGKLIFSDRTKARFSRRGWQQMNAEEGKSRVIKEQFRNVSILEENGIAIACEEAFCEYTKHGHKAMIVRAWVPDERCSAAEAVVILTDLPACSSHPHRITREILAETGTQVWWLGKSGIKTTSVREERGTRRWTQRR